MADKKTHCRLSIDIPMLEPSRVNKVNVRYLLTISKMKIALRLYKTNSLWTTLCEKLLENQKHENENYNQTFPYSSRPLSELTTKWSRDTTFTHPSSSRNRLVSPSFTWSYLTILPLILVHYWWPNSTVKQ